MKHDIHSLYGFVWMSNSFEILQEMSLTYANPKYFGVIEFYVRDPQ